MKKLVVMLGVMSFLLVGCGQAPVADDVVKNDDQPMETTQIANPASENCVAVGGQNVRADVTIDGEKFGEYGICEFEDNMMCEEWALMNGNCPAGGVKVTGYVSEAGKYCGITGGTYAVTSLSGETFEQGTCTGKDGKECEVWDYYRGACSIN